MTHVNRYIIINGVFTALKILCALPVHLYLRPLWQLTTALFPAFIVLPFPECCRVGIIQHVVFSNWLLSFSNRHLSFKKKKLSRAKHSGGTYSRSSVENRWSVSVTT